MNSYGRSVARTWTQRCGRGPRGIGVVGRGLFLSACLTCFVAVATSDGAAHSVAATGDVCVGGPASGDTDGDGVVGRTDFAQLVSCLAGPNVPLALSVCKCFDMDQDSDVDLVDVSNIAGMFSVPIGCTINERFYKPGERGEYPENCGVCDPALSTTSWTPMATGGLCNPGLGRCMRSRRVLHRRILQVPRGFIPAVRHGMSPGLGRRMRSRRNLSGHGGRRLPGGHGCRHEHGVPVGGLSVRHAGVLHGRSRSNLPSVEQPALRERGALHGRRAMRIRGMQGRGLCGRPGRMFHRHRSHRRRHL